MDLRSVLQEKTAKQDRMRELFSAKEKEGRAFTAAELSEYNSCRAEAEKLDQKAKIMAEKAEHMRAGLDRSPEGREFAGLLKKFSIRSLIRDIAHRQTGNTALKADAEIEHEVCAELAKDSPVNASAPGAFHIPERALVTEHKRTDITSASDSGGALISELVKPSLYVEGLYRETWIGKVGCLMLNSLDSKIVLPGVSDKPSFGWSDGNSAFVEQSMTFEKSLELSPRFAGCLQPLSLSILVQNTNDSLESLVRGELLRSFQSGVEKDLLAGMATTTRPAGIMEIAGTTEIEAQEASNTDGSKPSLSTFMRAERKLFEKNQFSEPVWIINSDLETFAKSTLRWGSTVGSMPLLDRGLLVDRRYVRTNSMPNDRSKGSGSGLSEAALVIPSSIVCARWGGGMQLSVSTQESEAFKAGGVLIRLLDSLNIGLRRKADVVRVENIITTLS